MDKTVVGFKTTNPDFTKTYKTNRIILDPSKTATTLKGTVTNSADNTFVVGATVAIEGTKLNAIRNDKGEYEMKPITIGTANLIASASKFKDKRISNIAVKKGQINKQDISLDPA